ncbi:MBL fold metallo-hydrolase [Phaeovulum vinaykumarii]|uniref:Glyoxylase, beta-lactamase superfamily II n=1 Tax=Phaeovulum vinaykumarii TaxID=407234 RepID=A0A1N7KA53_9RHOB|nr:MBL fold metallo-hydrolase [Phaeovulum vinaykumarii]SIS58380.1 Glyoxylase, beta-lactamase superfamily II [Phaeovulum vinaykumarii]SOB93772.1 glyoxylase-like metal-dependent hydrolase (beta-lactamase superfamily II) [Phaeovulum vinaykumarii]
MNAPIRYPWTAPPEPGAALEVAPGVLWLRLPLPMALDHVNCLALDDGDGWTLVDTGFDSRRSRAIWEGLLTGPLGGRPVRRVLVTHYHPDHVGLAGWFMARGAELVTSRLSWLWARMLTLDVQPLPTAQTLDFWRDAGLPEDELARRATERPFNFADCVHPLPYGFTRLSEGDIFHAGGRTWDVRMGDGHAPEHVTLWSRDDDLVIGGDQLLPSISANIGVYASEPDADPLADWLDACARLANHAEDRHLVLPGHKTPFTGLPVRLRQMADNHIGALARLRSHLETPRTAIECFPPLFAREIGPAETNLALVEAVAHLNHLLRRGEVTRTRSDTGAWVWRLP